MEEAPHECPCGDDHAPCQKAKTNVRFCTHHPVTLDNEPGDIGLLQAEIGKILEDRLDPELIGFLIALSPRCADAGTFGSIEHSELNASGIGIETHEPPECVDLANHVALGQAPDGWVT